MSELPEIDFVIRTDDSEGDVLVAEISFPRAPRIDALMATPPKTYSVKNLRRRLKLTQEEFAVIYGVDLRTLQNYESGTRKPDGTAIGYFALIEKAPEAVKHLRLSA